MKQLRQHIQRIIRTALLVFCAFSGITGAEAQYNNGVYTIRFHSDDTNTDYYLGDNGDGTAMSTKNYANQTDVQWVFESDGAGGYYIKSLAGNYITYTNSTFTAEYEGNGKICGTTSNKNDAELFVVKDNAAETHQFLAFKNDQGNHLNGYWGVDYNTENKRIGSYNSDDYNSWVYIDPVSPTEWGNLFSTEAAPVWLVIKYTRDDASFWKATNSGGNVNYDPFTNDGTMDRQLFMFERTTGNKFIIVSKARKYVKISGDADPFIIPNEATKANATEFTLSYVDGKTVITTARPDGSVGVVFPNPATEGGNKGRLNLYALGTDDWLEQGAVEIFPDISNVAPDLTKQYWIRFASNDYRQRNYLTYTGGNRTQNVWTSTRTLEANTRWRIKRWNNGRFTLHSATGTSTLLYIGGNGVDAFTVTTDNETQNTGRAFVLYRNNAGAWVLRMPDNQNHSPNREGGGDGTNNKVIDWNNFDDVNNQLEFVLYDGDRLPMQGSDYYINLGAANQYLTKGDNAGINGSTSKDQVWQLQKVQDGNGYEGVFYLKDWEGKFLYWDGTRYKAANTTDKTAFVVYPTSNGTNGYLQLMRADLGATKTFVNNNTTTANEDGSAVGGTTLATFSLPTIYDGAIYTLCFPRANVQKYFVDNGLGADGNGVKTGSNALQSMQYTPEIYWKAHVDIEHASSRKRRG